MDDTDTGSETTRPLDAEALKREFSRLRASLDAVKEKLGGNAHDVFDRVSSYIDEGKLGARLDDIEDELSHLATKLKKSGRDAADRLESEVSAKPIASIAIAFGVGLLAAHLLRRR